MPSISIELTFTIYFMNITKYLRLLLRDRIEEDYLLTCWKNAVRNFRGNERDFLRELHGSMGLGLLSMAIHRELLFSKRSVALTSVWVDHTPQCWFGMDSSAWDKPSCELADLLVIVWDNHERKQGLAILLQAKMAKNPFNISSKSRSTKYQLHLLEQAPKFLLSNNTKRPPIPYTGNQLTSEFCLSHLTSFKHCRVLQIKEKNSRMWNTRTPWAVYWRKPRYINGYAKVLAEMILKNNAQHLGERFTVTGKDDWSRLVNTLITSTLNVCKGTARGSLQNSINFQPAIHHQHFNPRSISDSDTFPFDYKPDSENMKIQGGGISTLFITPYPPND